MAYKYGRIVFISFENCSIPSNIEAQQRFSSIGETYIPIYNVSFVDAINMNKRIIVETTGYIYSTSALTSGTLIRGGVCYIAKHA